MSEPIALHDRPRLAKRARLRFDRHSGEHVLLSPERGLLLSSSAADVVRACCGTRTVAQIVGELSRGAELDRVRADVVELLEALRARHLIELLGGPS